MFDLTRVGARLARRFNGAGVSTCDLSDADAEKLFDAMEADERLIMLFLDEELVDDEMDAVEQRLMSDAAFYRRGLPQMETDALVRQHRAALVAGMAPEIRFPRRPAAHRAGILFVALLVVSGIGAGGAGVVSVSRSREAVTERRQGRAVTTHFWPRTSQEETAAEAKTLFLAEATVVLRPNSRWETGLPWPTNRQFATLDGGALLEMRAVGLRVVTATAEVRMGAGYFELTSVPGSGVTVVKVFSGKARVGGLGARGIDVDAGHEVRVDGSGAITQEVIARPAGS